jgi:ketosteroid isomerase-like protein
VDRSSAKTRETIERFNEAFNRHDVDAVMALMTDDVIFENTSPPPDGERFAGQTEVRAFWERFFAGSPRAHFETEELFVAGDRCTVRWRYSWGDGHVRGVDLFRVRDGKVSEKLSYVKG